MNQDVSRAEELSVASARATKVAEKLTIPSEEGDAVILGFGDDGVADGIDADAKGTGELAPLGAFRAKVAEEEPPGGEDLDAVVAAVGEEDVVGGVDAD